MLGSYFGGVTTVLYLIAALTYLSMLITQMESGDYDQIKNTVMTNPMGQEGEKNNLTLVDYTFMPIIELFDFPSTGFDIFKGNPADQIIDLDKFYTYVTPLAC